MQSMAMCRTEFMPVFTLILIAGTVMGILFAEHLWQCLLRKSEFMQTCRYPGCLFRSEISKNYIRNSTNSQHFLEFYGRLAELRTLRPFR